MSTRLRFAASWNALLSGRTLDARLRLIARTAAGMVALAFTIVIAGQLLQARRINDLQRVGYPALRDSRALGSTLAGVREQLAAAPRAPEAIDRADSLAARFHAIARSSSIAPLAELDRRFGDYYMVGRAAAVQADASPTAREASRIAEAGVGELASQLAAEERAATHTLDEDVAGVAALHEVVLRALGATAVAWLALLTLLAVVARGAVTASVDEIADAIDAVRGGRMPLIPEEESGAAARVHAALRRLARLSDDNMESARALASGAYREVLHAYPVTDALGHALTQIAANMDAHAAAAHRIARGDLRAAVTPQSDDDAFGHAQAAMLRRVTDSLADLDATRAALEQAVVVLGADVAGLATAAAVDAEALRRTLDRVAKLTVQARIQADRGAALTRRADESERMVRQGASAFAQAHADLKAVVGRSEAVQQLARSTSLLAVRARERMEPGHPLDDEARALAAEAAASSRIVTRARIDGSERALESAVSIDRVAIAVRDGAALVHEVSAASLEHADQLTGIDDALVQLHGDTTRRAEQARGIGARIDGVMQQVRRLDTAIRRFRRPGPPRATATDAVLTGPTLYRTPVHAPAVLPMMALAGR